MKTLLSGVVVVLATSYVAMAQPAYNPAEGGPPPSYPPCTHPGEDRCTPGGPMGHMMGHHRGHHMGAHHKGGHHKGHRGHHHHKK